MARILIAGCGCRGRELATRLAASGHAVRGTTRERARLEAIEHAAAEAVVADPDRLSTLLPHLEGTSAICWLMGSAVGEPELVAALHGPRLESLLETIVDTPVRGLVYEAVGTVHPSLLEQGARAARDAGARHRVPVELLDADPGEPAVWARAAASALDRVLLA